jgi:hypothetical protein
MKRSAPIKRTPLARVGRKAKKDAPRRAEVIKRVHKRDRYCRFYHYVSGIGSDHCTGPLDVHEIVPRSVWPDGDLDDTNCVLLCRHHHQWIDSHRDLAELFGLYSRVKP